MISGYVVIAVTFAASIYSMISFIRYYRTENESIFRQGTVALYVMSGGILIALTMLVYLILTHNFQVNYVYSYSSRILNKFYLFSTLWAGQEGTFLMWAFFGSIYGIVLLKTVAKKNPLVLTFLLSVQVFLLLILIRKSPFAMIWDVHENVNYMYTPQDGAGLNPLLQNPWMVIHPPVLFVGYSSTVVAFAFALAAMTTKNFQEWIKDARPWVIFNVGILGTGIMMGGYWAYTTLGWGGYWAWDPVENASLVPWLFSLALLHGIIIQAKRQALVRTNILWAGLAFLTMLWGSFLTRSGVLTDFSVHSFAPSGLTFFLALFQTIFTVLFSYCFIKFLRNYKNSGRNEVEFGQGFLNRETFIFGGMMAILFVAIFVLVGTSMPLYTSWTGTPTSLSPDFYNLMIIPVALLMFVAVAIAPLLAWKTSALRDKRTLVIGLGTALFFTILAIFVGLGPLESLGGGTVIYGPQSGGFENADGLNGFVFNYFVVYSPFILFFLAVFVIFINAKFTILFFKQNYVKAGGYLVHVGLGFVLIGIITSSIYSTTTKVMLPRGELTETEMGHKIRFIEFVKMPDGRDQVKLEIRTNYGSQYIALPQFYFSNYSRAYMVAPDVQVGLVRDIYLSPISYTPANLANYKVLNLKKKESGKLDDLTITFNHFDVKMAAADRQEVTADLTVQTADINGNSTLHQVNALLVSDRGQLKSSLEEVPGTGYKIRLAKVNARDGSLQLKITPPARDGKKPKDILAIELSEKPLIGLLWFGTILFVAGSGLSLVNRKRNKRRVKSK